MRRSSSMYVLHAGLRIPIKAHLSSLAGTHPNQSFVHSGHRVTPDDVALLGGAQRSMINPVDTRRGRQKHVHRIASSRPRRLRAILRCDDVNAMGNLVRRRDGREQQQHDDKHRLRACETPRQQQAWNPDARQGTRNAFLRHWRRNTTTAGPHWDPSWSRAASSATAPCSRQSPAALGCQFDGTCGQSPDVVKSQ